MKVKYFCKNSFFKAKIRAEVRDADGELLPLEQQTQVHPLDNGKFQLLFTPRKSGKYKIYLYCSG